jgi:hypothetical protein
LTVTLVSLFAGYQLVEGTNSTIARTILGIPLVGAFGSGLGGLVEALALGTFPWGKLMWRPFVAATSGLILGATVIMVLVNFQDHLWTLLVGLLLVLVGSAGLAVVVLFKPQGGTKMTGWWVAGTMLGWVGLYGLLLRPGWQIKGISVVAIAAAALILAMATRTWDDRRNKIARGRRDEKPFRAAKVVNDRLAAAADEEVLAELAELPVLTNEELAKLRSRLQ